MISRRAFFGSAVAAALLPREILAANKSILTNEEMALHIACHYTQLVIMYITTVIRCVTIKSPEVRNNVIHIPEIIDEQQFNELNQFATSIDLSDVRIRSIECIDPNKRISSIFYKESGGWKEWIRRSK